MSNSGLPEHASVENLSSDFGVQIKKTCQYVPPNENTSDDFFIKTARMHIDKLIPVKRKADDGNTEAVCFTQEAFCTQQIFRRFSVGIVVCLLLLVGGSIGCIYHIDHKYAKEVAGLKEEFQRLQLQCWESSRSAKIRSGSSASDVDVDARTADGTGQNAGPGGDVALAPAGVGAMFPHLGVSSLVSRDVSSTRGQNGRGWPNADSVDDDNEDNDAGDASVSDKNENADDENPVRRVRRSSSAKDDKKSKGTGTKGINCKRYRSCKKTQDNGGSVNSRCQKIMACFPKVGDGSTSSDTECKRWLTCIEKDKPSITDPVPSVDKAPAFTPKAVHFYSDFWNDRRQQEFGRELCIYVEEWNGTACRNRTVIIRQPNTPLKFLQSADWMEKVYKDQSEQPIQKTNDGGFQVKQSGLYLIYSSVMFHEERHRWASAVVVNGLKRFKCMDGVDYVDKDLPKGENQAKYKTCAMTGVTHLSENDRLEVQNLYDQTEIDLSTDATYFGAVLISPGRVKEEQKSKAP